MIRSPELRGRTIKGLAVRGALAFLVLAAGPGCAKEQQSNSNSKARQETTQTATKTNPISSFESLPLEQQAIQKAISSWLSFERADAAQRVDNGLTSLIAFFNKEPIPASEAERISQMIMSNPKGIDSPITMSWKITQIPDPKNDKRYVYGNKEIGQARFNFIRVTKVQTEVLSAADRANGLTWSGGVSLDFTTQSRVLIQKTDLIGLAQRQPFLDLPSPALPSSFSPYGDDTYRVEVKRKATGWSAQPLIIGGFGNRSTDYLQVAFPSQVIANGFYCPTPTQSCKTEIVQVPPR